MGERRRFLLIVNAGPRCVPIAKHLGTDCDVLSLDWHPESRVDVPDAKRWRVKNRGARKFMALAEALEEHDLSAYEAIVAIDDDVQPVGCTWTGILRLGLENGFDVWHPALTHESHTAHFYLLQEPGVLCRRVNWIDIQAVAFTRKAFARWAPSFMSSGAFSWGLPGCWAALERVGCLDATPIHHPAQHAESGAWKGIGTVDQALREKVAFERSHGLPGKSTDGGDYMTLERRMKPPVTSAIAIPHASWVPARASNMADLRPMLRNKPGIVVQEFSERGPWHERLIRRCKWALETGAERFVQLEDDVMLAPSFVPALHAMHAAWRDDVICFASTHPLAPLVQQQGRRSYRAPALRGWAWSAPMHWIRRLVEYAGDGGLDAYLKKDDGVEDVFLIRFFVLHDIFPRHPVPTIVDHRHMPSTNAGFDAHTGTSSSVTWRGFAAEDLAEPEWWNTAATQLTPDYTETIRALRGRCVWCSNESGEITSAKTGAGLCNACLRRLMGCALGYET